MSPIWRSGCQGVGVDGHLRRLSNSALPDTRDPNAIVPEWSWKRARDGAVLSNYLRGARRDALIEAWTDEGVEFTFVGAFGESQLDPVAAIQATDIVVGKARAALEGMACGRAVAVTHHAARDHASRLVELLRDGMLREEDRPHPAVELSRHARAAWTAERRAINAEWQLAGSLARARDAEQDRDRWQASALQAERDVQEMRALLTTRRVRFGISLGRRLDRLRGR